MNRGTANVAASLPDEVGQGSSDGRPLTAVPDPWNDSWEPPEHRDLARKHARARKRERLLARHGHSAPIDPDELDALPEAEESTVDGGGWLARLIQAIAVVATAYWYYTIATIGIAVLVPLTIGWNASTVATGSMEPSISPGDVVAFTDYGGQPLRVGSIIQFDDPVRPEQTVTHRIIAVNADGTYQTKGDANPNPDSVPVSAADITGVARIVTPRAGLPQLWASNGDWEALTAWIAVTVAAALAATLYGRAAEGHGPGRRSILRPALAFGLVAALGGVGTAAWSSAAFAASDANDGSIFESAASFASAPYLGSPGQATCAVGQTTAFTLPTGIDLGNTVIVRYAFRDSRATAPLAATDSRGNTYTVDAYAINGKHAESGVLSAHVTTALQSGDQITVTHPEGRGVAVVFDVFSGIPETSRVSTSATAIGRSSTPSVQATTTDVDTLAIGTLAVGADDTITQPPGWTALDSGVAACTKPLTHGGARTETSDPGTITYAPTITTSDQYAATLVIYRTGG